MHVLVIGGGPGGYVAAIRAAQLGAQVTLVEKDHLGGACLNVGCIPTKALLHAATLYTGAKAGAEYGVNITARLDFAATQKKKRAVVKKLVAGVAGLLAANKVVVKKGTAAFVDTRSIQISCADGTTEKVVADKIIIAVGSVPSFPPIPGIDSPLCIDSTGALALEEIPEHMVIIGGGIIGVEMADIYFSLGSKVTIVEIQPEILPSLDRDIAVFARKALQQKGISIYVNTNVNSVSIKDGQAKVIAQRNGQEIILDCDKVLVATGRRSAAADLSLEKAGIAHDRGMIKVDKHLETNIPGIYAIGDCIPGIMLAHVASRQGEIAAENTVGHLVEYVEKNVPSCVYIDPELASVGLTEQEVKEREIKYKVGKFPLTANGRALILNDGQGFVKVISGIEYGELLGLHIVGPHATELLAEGALALEMEATADEIISTVHAHPTISEAIREAVLASEHRAIHIKN